MYKAKSNKNIKHQNRLYGLGIKRFKSYRFLNDESYRFRIFRVRALTLIWFLAAPLALVAYIPSPDAGIRILSLGIVASVLTYILFPHKILKNGQSRVDN